MITVEYEREDGTKPFKQTKKRQQSDINKAKKYWKNYKDRKQKLA